MKRKGDRVMKRLLCLSMCSLLLLAVPVWICAQETDNGFLYKVFSHGYASITGYAGGETEMVVPSEIKGYPVRSIGKGAFTGNGQLLSVILPEGIESIGDNAFDGCGSLAAVSLPSTIREIGEFAFAGCYALPAIDIPIGVTGIKNKTFVACEALRKISLPAKLKTIGGAAFAASGIESIDLPQNLTEIGPDAFAACPNLVNIRIPNRVRKIGRLAFDGCVMLESVILPAGLSSLNALFSGCASLREAAIPASVKSIAADGTFDGCDQVTILGFRGTEAEKYAVRHNIPFTAFELVNKVALFSSGEDVSGGTIVIDLSSGNNIVHLEALTSPDNPWPGAVWKSSAPKVASVSADGTIRGLRKGRATLTAIAVDGSRVKAVCVVNVIDPAD